MQTKKHLHHHTPMVLMNYFTISCLQQPDWRGMCAGGYDISLACN